MSADTPLPRKRRARCYEPPHAAPFYCLDRHAWIACAVWRDSRTGLLGRIHGPRGFPTYGHARQASRFLCRRAAARRG